MTNLDYLSIPRAHDLLVNGEITTVALTKYYLAKIKQFDPKIRATLSICEAEALAQAKAADKRLATGKNVQLLTGIPYSAKDMFLTRGVRTTAASKMLDNFIPPANATVIEKLNQAGAVLLAKVNQDEFAHGSSTENSAYHVTHNPWDLSRVPGGSSGGSAAALSADLGIFSIGTDTGGSIRTPAAYCGVVGLKPTYGLVSRYGVVAMASSLDCVSPLARSVEDVAIVLETLAGPDEKDATSISASDYNYQKAVASADKVKGLKLGVVKQSTEALDEANKTCFEQSVRELKQAGADIQTVSLPHLELALPCYYIITPAEISSNLERYDGTRYGLTVENAKNLEENYLLSRQKGFGPEVKRRIMIGTYVLSAGYYEAYYKKAMQVRTLIKQDFDRALGRVDALLGPTMPGPAFKIGENVSDPLKMYLADVMTVAANLAGVPAISIPAGEVAGLPIGLQILSAQKAEAAIFKVAAAYEARTAWSKKVPTL